MVEVNGFTDYEYCPLKSEVFRAKKRLKAHYSKKQKYWWLYRDGEKLKVRHWQILLNNWEKIEREVLKKVTDF